MKCVRNVILALLWSAITCAVSEIVIIKYIERKESMNHD